MKQAYLMRIRIFLFFFCLIFSLVVLAAESKGTVSKAVTEPQRDVSLVSSQIADSIRDVGPRCAAAAEPACLSAVAAVPAAEMDSRTVDGLLGDYIGGVFGTIVSVITMFVVFFAWNTSRKIDYSSKAYQVFAEMLRVDGCVTGGPGRKNGLWSCAKVLAASFLARAQTANRIQYCSERNYTIRHSQYGEGKGLF